MDKLQCEIVMNYTHLPTKYCIRLKIHSDQIPTKFFEVSL